MVGWQKIKRRLRLPYPEYDVSEDEALQVVIQRHETSEGLNAYGRVELALRPEPYFRKRSGWLQPVMGNDLTSAARVLAHAWLLRGDPVRLRHIEAALERETTKATCLARDGFAL